MEEQKNLDALYNAIIVTPFEFEEESYGNLVIPDMENEVNKMGKVVAVGPGYWSMGQFIKTQLSVGDLVVLPSMGFTKFRYRGDEYWIGKENEVLAKIENKK